MFWPTASRPPPGRPLRLIRWVMWANGGYDGFTTLTHYVTLPLGIPDRKGDGTQVLHLPDCLIRSISMASWEDELAVLLRELGVTQEEQKEQEQRTYRSTRQAGGMDFSLERFPVPRRNEVKRKVQSADAFFWGHKGDSMDITDGMAYGENDEAWMGELRVMRREVESIVSQVVYLM